MTARVKDVDEVIEEDEKQRRMSRFISEKELTDLPPVPISQRKCTDVLFLLLFVVMWLGAIILGAIGFTNGDPNRLIYGSDAEGRRCGGAELPNHKYVVYPRTQQDLVIIGKTGYQKPSAVHWYTVCAERCPMQNETVCNDVGNMLLSNATTLRSTTREEEASLCLEGAFASPQCYDPAIRKNCWPTIFDTVSVLFRCMPEYLYKIESLPESGCARYSYSYDVATNTTIPTCVVYRSVTKRTTEEPTASDILMKSFNTGRQMFYRYVADIMKAWPVIVTSGVLVAVAVGLIYIVSLWFFIRLVVWGSVFGVQVMSIIFTLFLYIKAGVIEVEFLTYQANLVNGALGDLSQQVSSVTGEDLVSAPPINITQSNTTIIINGKALPAAFAVSDDYATQFTYGAYFMTFVTIALFFIILLLGRRIARAIEIFEQASHAIRANPTLVFIPLCSVPCIVLVCVWWAASTAYLASSGTYETVFMNTTVVMNAGDEIISTKQFGSFSYIEVFIVFQFFAFLWTSNFIAGIVVMTVAGTVTSWYWAGSPEAGEEQQRNRHPLLRSIFVTIRFHMGTVSFGALVVSVIQFIRYISAYVEQRAQAGTKRTRIARAVHCVVQYCLRCLEACISFVSRNAFISTAMYGESFCPSAKHAFDTLASNIAQVALVTFLGDVILRFGQIFIALTSGFACWLYLDVRPEYGLGGELELNSHWFPTFIATLLGWFAANETLSIYDITVETLLLSFCQDQKLRKAKADHQLKSSKSFKEFVEGNGADSPRAGGGASLTMRGDA